MRKLQEVPKLAILQPEASLMPPEFMNHPKPTADQLQRLCPQYTSFSYKNEGGFKFVYKVEETGNSDEILKIIFLPTPTGTPESIAAFNEALGRVEREATAIGVCASPYIVKLGRLAPSQKVIDGEHCVVYSEEVVPGADLNEIISQGHTPSEQECKQLLSCLVRAINTLWYQHQLVHRDIKPANVMKTNLPDRPFVMLDLGIAYSVTEAGLTLNTSNRPMTPRYMAPEMADPNFRDTIDFRCDLYTAALTTFEFAAKQHPLSRASDDPIMTISRAVFQEPAKLNSLRPDFTPEFCDLVDQLLKKKPLLRPSNLSLLIQRLES